MSASSEVDGEVGAEAAGARVSGSEAAVWVDVESLVPWASNPRDAAGSAPRVAASIVSFAQRAGNDLVWLTDEEWAALDPADRAERCMRYFGDPLVARLVNSEIIAGHARHLAAKLLGLPQVPVRFVDVSESEAHRMALASNRLPEITEWRGLDDVLDPMTAADLELAGFPAPGGALAEPPKVKPIKLGAVASRFSITIRGPADQQPEALEVIRAQLGKLHGVEIETWTIKL